MKANTNNKKPSARKKILPAAGMLAISATMLATSTYAWFTMSREVEVKNIKMTATVPEDLQISLGKLAVTGTPATAVTESDSTTYSLAGSTGVLYAAANSVAGDMNAVAPENIWDWSNSADVSAYYDFGRLIPASSNDGAEIFFTPDASGVGKTVEATANYIQATNKLTPVNDTGTNTNYRTTLHAFTSADDKAGENSWKTKTYKQADKYNKTNDDGYYVDIPVWIRSSSNAAIDLSVDGYVIPGSVKEDGDTQTHLELYRAVRVAILDGADVTANQATGAVACTAGDPAVATNKNIIPLKDAWSTDGTTMVYSTLAKTDNTTYTADKIKASNTPFADGNKSILDSLNYKRSTVGVADMGDTDLYGVSALASEQSTATDGSKYTQATYTKYTAISPTSVTEAATPGTPDTVATIEGSTTGGEYGTAKKLVIRVWLDGEDQECWNDNAGQDWAISLKFSKIETNNNNGG